MIDKVVIGDHEFEVVRDRWVPPWMFIFQFDDGQYAVINLRKDEVLRFTNDEMYEIYLQAEQMAFQKKSSEMDQEMAKARMGESMIYSSLQQTLSLPSWSPDFRGSATGNDDESSTP